MSSQIINQAANPVTVVTQADRISLTVFFALAFHAIIILGISFDIIKNPEEMLSTMEVTLVHQKSLEAPDEADYLAQADQMGGGTQQSKSRPSSPFSNPLPTNEQGFAPSAKQAVTPPPMQKSQKQQEIMTVDESAIQSPTSPQTDQVPVETKSITSAQLFERSQQIARLSQEINKLKQAYQQTPKHTWVHGANAKAYRFASYMDAWRQKVERIGNINYPEVAARKKLSGKLLLDVAINPDGTIHSARVSRSSGHKELDQAALRIVNLAAPYPPLTKDILKDTDILHIPRVWSFSSDSTLATSSN